MSAWEWFLALLRIRTYCILRPNVYDATRNKDMFLILIEAFFFSLASFSLCSLKEERKEGNAFKIGGH